MSATDHNIGESTPPASCDLIGSMVDGIGTVGNPYRSAAVLCGACVAITFITSSITKNYSQVDKLWSIIPFIYAWIAVCDDRTLLMAAVATIWGVRLSWNFSRRGGFKFPKIWEGDEDYRWEILQQGGLSQCLTNPVIWQLFNFGFISLYQNILLLLIATPSFVAYTVSTSKSCQSSDINILDAIAALGVIFFIIMESIADNQQYTFQTEKYRLRNAGLQLSGAYKDGFCQSGLYAIVRKPNYTAEQSIWICFYLFSIAATGSLWNWSGTGFVLLVLLFQGSGFFTEMITIGKYPKYKEYMQQVPLYVPNPFRKGKSTPKTGEENSLLHTDNTKKVRGVTA